MPTSCASSRLNADIRILGHPDNHLSPALNNLAGQCYEWQFQPVRPGPVLLYQECQQTDVARHRKDTDRGGHFLAYVDFAVDDMIYQGQSLFGPRKGPCVSRMVSPIAAQAGVCARARIASFRYVHS